VVDDRAGVWRVTAREVEIEIDRLSDMEEILLTHALRPLISFDHKYSLTLSLLC